MSKAKRDSKLEKKLHEMLAERFPGIDIRVEHSDRWQRMGVTYRWSGFAGLLPEERFQRLAAALPDSFREQELQGLVWLELATDESVDQFLKLPRSEDVAEREDKLYEKMIGDDFFARLKKAMGKSPQKSCGGDLSVSAETLSEAGWAKKAVRDAKLVFIRHGAYCDCQVLETVGPKLQEQYGS